ncbi:dehydrogenase [Sphaerisporangium siamense]|nr:dehydrogenase [Sphaerisporangium siamense]
MMRVAVLGIGHMGRAIALRLLGQGHQVTVWNRTPGKAADVVRAGAAEASSPLGAALGADAALMSLSDDAAVLAVMRGLIELEGDRDSPVIVDTSTVAPDTSRSLRDVAPRRRFVAAPVLGAPGAVEDGTASGLLGGERRLAETLEPVWASLFATHWYCGADPGNATTVKLLSNYQMMAGIAVAAEALAAAEGAGLDPRLLREVFFPLPTIAPALRNRLGRMLDGDHDGWFTTRLGAKDVRLLAETAESLGVVLPIARLVERRYEEAAAQGHGDDDITAVIELVRPREP